MKKKSKQIGLTLCMLFFTVLTFAQQRTVKGKVLDQSGEPMSNVSFTIKDSQVGGMTDSEGAFSVQVDGNNAVLVFTAISHKTKEVPVGDQSELTVVMEPQTGSLTEVVVTALGIKRERKSLGYSVTEVAGNSLTEARDPNMMNSLAGRVAGLNITAGSGGPGASNNVLIRGLSSIGGTTQPLYVVNGIPMENNRGYQAATQWDNGPDIGDGIGDLNPDDIESISVLKGAAASALYGYRAKAGVIMITTKSAKGSGVEFNSNFTANQVMDMTDWQYVYGLGSNNRKPNDAEEASQVGNSSWGAKIDGSQSVQFDGVNRPYSAVKNNISNFYRVGPSRTNTLTLNQAFTGGSVRFSASNLNDKSIVPNSKIDRNTFDLTVKFEPVKNLTIDVRNNYILDKAKNRAMLSDGAGNANFQIMFLPTTLDVRTLKPGWEEDGSEKVFVSTNPWATNPYFQTEKFINNTSRNRLISSVTARYEFGGGYYVQGRAGRDSYREEYLNVVPTGTAYRPTGSMSLQNTNFSDLNTDILAGKTFTIEDFSISPVLGASYRRTKSVSLTNGGDVFNVPFLYNIRNLQNQNSNYGVVESVTQSTYANVELSYRDYLFLNGSVRSDWFSTLATPGIDNKLNVVYPGINGSFVFSSLWNPEFLNYGKIRAGYAEVGQATDPYQTALTYSFAGPTVDGHSLGLIDNGDIPNAGLRPSRAHELEFGLEFSILKNLISADVSWYNKKSTDEIIPVPTSSTSGYSGAVLNIGSMRNSGVEALVTINPFRNVDGFNWSTSFNGAVNNNKILALAEGVPSMPMGTSRSGVAFVQHVQGLPAFQIMAFDYKYDTDGKVQHEANGSPAQGELKAQGSAIPKWTLGWNNDFRYKKLSLSVLIEGKWGAKIYSGTDYYGYINGLHKATLVDREENFAGSGGGTLQAQAYYNDLVNNVSSVNVQSADFIKMRQIVLGYTFNSLWNNVVKSLTISAVARNPFILSRKTDNIDPEGSFSSWIPGLELGGIPPIRSYGVNLNVKF